MKQINELFALPIGMHEVAKYGGVPLYGSTVLNQRFIEAMKTNKRTKDIGKTIEKMVLEKKIVPCFADPGLISYFRRKISNNTSGGLMRILKLIVFAPNPISNPFDYVLAFYDFESKNITVLISNHLLSGKLFETEAADLAIAQSLTHEIMHMYAHVKPSTYLSTFKDELTLYYSTYFTKVFKLKPDKKKDIIVEEFYKYLFIQYEMKSININSLNIDKLMNILSKFEKYSKMNKDDFHNVLTDFIKLTRLLNNNHNNLPEIIPLLKGKFKYLVKPLFTSYRAAFGKIPNKGCTQEAYYPSEVTCGFSDINFNSKVKSAINSII